MVNDNTSYLANLEFLINYNDGQSKDEIESEIFRVALQKKYSIPYDRDNGGSFSDIEQEKNTEIVAMMFSADLIQSIYKLNQSKNFNPYIVLGYSDIQVDRSVDEYKLRVQWRKLQDLSTNGNRTIPI